MTSIQGPKPNVEIIVFWQTNQEGLQRRLTYFLNGIWKYKTSGLIHIMDYWSSINIHVDEVNIEVLKAQNEHFHQISITRLLKA